MGPGWVFIVKEVAMPKLPPPPPRQAQYSSSLPPALALRTLPSAVTTWIALTLSRVSPYLRAARPIPPPRARPAIPTVGQEPPGTVSPWRARVE